jgi:hypothetical protein
VKESRPRYYWMPLIFEPVEPGGRKNDPGLYRPIRDMTPVNCGIKSAGGASLP